MQSEYDFESKPQANWLGELMFDSGTTGYISKQLTPEIKTYLSDKAQQCLINKLLNLTTQLEAFLDFIGLSLNKHYI